MGTNFIKSRIYKTQQNSKCRLYGDRHETVNLIISECSKLAQIDYKIRYDRESSVIYWEWGAKLKLDYSNDWYMRYDTVVLENDTHKLI